jgi:hypothetical protein
MRKAKQELLNKPSKSYKEESSAAYFPTAWDKKNMRNASQVQTSTSKSTSAPVAQKSNGPTARKRSGSAIKHIKANEGKLYKDSNGTRELTDTPIHNRE